MVGNRAGGHSDTPFPAIVGQEELKRVLQIVAIDDALDGALIVGEKGTAKSTSVRALVDLLPEQRAVADCPYGCPPDDPRTQCGECRERSSSGESLPVETRQVPIVTLPLGATRDRVVGTLSVADALAGEADFDPGLLARANRGFLYVDEVNLLDDHLVDVVLDAAASGVNTVERDGISVSHPAAFTLIGTMNPEEGALRPQLRDRFALQATVEGARDLDNRVEIIDRALDRSADGSSFADSYADAVETLSERLVAARERLDAVDLPHGFRVDIAELCADAGIDGHRGDIAIARTARTLAALDGRSKVIDADVTEAVRYALPHRLQSRPFEDAPNLEELLDDQGERAETGDVSEEGTDPDRSEDLDDRTGPIDDQDEPEQRDDDVEPNDGGDDGDGVGRGNGNSDDTGSGRSEIDSDGDDDGGSNGDDDGDSNGDDDGDSNGDDDGDNDGDGDACEEDETTPLVPGQRRAETERTEIGTARAPDVEAPTPMDEASSGRSGDRIRSTTLGDRGSRIRTEKADADDRVDAAASVRAAATRGADQVESDDLRRSVKSTTNAATIVFAVDASASMRPAMRAAKGVVIELLRDSYQQRDEVAFVAFAGDDAEVLLPPTTSVTLAARHLKDLPTGDRTPLPAGIDAARRIVEREEPGAAVVVLITDGRANVSDGSPTDATRDAARTLATTDASVLVVDAGDDSRAGLSELVATETGGETVQLSTLTPERVRQAVGTNPPTDPA